MNTNNLTVSLDDVAKNALAHYRAIEAVLKPWATELEEKRASGRDANDVEKFIRFTPNALQPLTYFKENAHPAVLEKIAITLDDRKNIMAPLHETILRAPVDEATRVGLHAELGTLRDELDDLAGRVGSLLSNRAPAASADDSIAWARVERAVKRVNPMFRALEAEMHAISAEWPTHEGPSANVPLGSKALYKPMNDWHRFHDALTAPLGAAQLAAGEFEAGDTAFANGMAPALAGKLKNSLELLTAARRQLVTSPTAEALDMDGRLGRLTHAVREVAARLEDVGRESAPSPYRLG